MSIAPAFYLSLPALLVVPHLFVALKWPDLPASLKTLWGFVASAVWMWLTALLVYALNLSVWPTRLLIWGGALFGLVFVWRQSGGRFLPVNRSGPLVWAGAAVLLWPLWHHLGVGFAGWDAVVSWNRWAIEMSEGRYEPLNAAYPVFWPAVWSLIYKLQGTARIWWTAQSVLLYFPLTVLVLLIQLYRESGRPVYILMIAAAYLTLTSYFNISGYMDVPVMTAGLLSLIAFYHAEKVEKNQTARYYFLAGLMIAGIASIVKQAGWAFLLFGYLYGWLRRERFKGGGYKPIVYLAPLLFWGTFLLVYYPNAYADITGNLNHLENITAHHLARISDLKSWIDFWLKNFYFTEWHNLESLAFSDNVMLWSGGLILLAVILAAVAAVLIKKRPLMQILLLLFLLGGAGAWLQCCAYDFRNLIWVKAFFVILLADTFAWIGTLFLLKTGGGLVWLLLFSLGGLVFVKSFPDRRLFAEAYRYQRKLGGEENAHAVNRMLKEKSECVKVYTDILPLFYNPLLGANVSRLVPMRYRLVETSMLNHDCSEGRYLLLRATDKLSPQRWTVEKLLADEKIFYAGGDGATWYFIPSGLALPVDYFANRTFFSDKQIENPVEGEVVYHIDRYTENGNVVRISGWAFAGSGTGRVYLTLSGREGKFLIGASGRRRYDVAKVYKNPGLVNSGFRLAIFKKELSAGEYRLGLAIKKSRRWYTVALPGKLHIEKRN